MNAYSQQGSSSALPSISDLDGYTLRDYNFPMSNSYIPADQDDFGFDPPDQKTPYPKLDNFDSPEQNDNLSLGGWPGFEHNGDSEPGTQGSKFDKLIAQNLSKQTTAVSRFGQVTPPRSNSAVSTNDQAMNESSLSPTAFASERRKRGKSSKEAEPQAPTSSGRKRKTSKKAAANTEPVEPPEESKRKQSLEKNRLAAAKCRVNKKEKTEQLQRDSHDKAVHNAFLKDQVIRMKEQVQQMNAILLAHASCDGCKSPEEIQQHLSDLGNDFFAQHMSIPSVSYSDYNQMDISDMSQMGHNSMMQDDYFGSQNHNQGPSMLHPPLPEFNRSAEFEVHTPMQAD